jgi:hypothetical protein
MFKTGGSAPLALGVFRIARQGLRLFRMDGLAVLAARREETDDYTT